MLVFMITLKVSEMKEPMNVNIGGEKKQISKYGNHILFHDAEFPWRQCVSLAFKHITYLFRMEIQILYCHNPGAMKFIRRRQSTPLWMTYAGNWLSSMYWTIENYEADKCIRTKGLCFRGWIPEDYDFSLKRDYEYVQAKRWNCRELEDVLKIARRSKEVILDESRLVSKNVNDFFNHWLENRIDGLKFLSIKMAYLSYTEALVFRGIEHRITDTTEEVNYKSFTGELYQLSPGKCLRRDDGVIALFYYDPNTWILNFDVVDVVN
uniref:FBA_2 domain-containing protein n=1 Tax=Caenorhabditis tropicalis TaxID=1561998 RepID=A0A1I7UZJ2_9PELO